MRNLPSLRALQVFEAVARLESLTKAGADLGLTQSAVSKQMAQLEDLVGQALLVRGHRRVTLTDTGRRLFRIAGSTLTELSARMASLTDQSPEALRIVAEADFLQLWLFPKLPRFRARHPEITLSIRSESSLQSPPDAGYDCALLWGRGDWRNCRFRPLLTNSVFPVAAPRYLAERAEQGLSAGELIHDRDSYWWSTFLSALGSALEAEQGTTFSSTALCLDAAVRGDGITIGDEVSARHYLESRSLVAPLDFRLPSPESYFLAEPKNSATQEAIAFFKTWIEEEAEQHRAWYADYWSTQGRGAFASSAFWSSSVERSTALAHGTE